ncbi:hypothetical protein [Mesorhizobium sp. STM 4661]|uniref:hypothetical protein n=1 Tax=Mesorhizobium sp. STM 4661 TaxID=1297570 RepID=UPI0012F92259|nr:hypothetical protein [Mesorhizobium sp. STM 4661]
MASGKCYLEGYGSCAGGISREHYISRNILEFGSTGKAVKIGGLPWQPPSTMQAIGLSSLAAPILCQHHNKSLKPMDTQAGRLMRVLNSIDKVPAKVSAITYVHGPTFERWMLKVFCGLAACGHFNNGFIPREWKEILVGGAWPAFWGAYFPLGFGPVTVSDGLSFETKVHPETREIKAVKFYFFGLHVNLCFGIPGGDYSGQMRWGIRQPRRINFLNEPQCKTIDLMWAGGSGEEVTYVRTGSTNSGPDYLKYFPYDDSA